MKRYIIASITLLIFLAGCSKFLKEEPETQYTANNFFVDKVSIDAGVVGMYSSVKDLFGIYTNTPLFIGMVGTDECMFRGSSGVRYNFDRYTFSPSDGSLYECWIRHYEIIARTNLLIDAARKVSGLTDQERNRAIGEAKFLRAFVYFRLVQFFGEIPIITEPITGDFDYGLPRAPISDVYALIQEDLSFASQDDILPTGKTNDGHASQWAAKSLLGKVFLTMASAKETGRVAGYAGIPESVQELYEKARTILKDVKDNSGASLLPVYSDVFKIENKNVNAESIFELQFSAISPYGTGWTKEMGMVASGSINGNPAYFTNAWAGSASEVYVPKFYKYYKESPRDPIDYDKRRSWNLADSLINVVNNAPASLTFIWASAYSPDNYNQTILGRCGITKYRWGNSWRDATEYVSSNTPNNVIVLRYADVLLMFAEADYKRNGVISEEGLEAINKVRQRARGIKADGTPVMPEETPGFNDYVAGDITIEEIMMERARELCFEFQRWFDLARTGMFEHFLELTRSASYTTIVNTSTSFDPNKHYLFPIPQSEIDLSTNKEQFRQNPNY